MNHSYTLLWAAIPLIALCIFLVRGNTREQNKRKSADKPAFSEKFGYIEYSTFDVVLLSICTAGFYYFYTAYIQGKKLSAYSNDAKLLPACALIASGVYYVIDNIDSMLDFTIIDNISRITETDYITIINASNILIGIQCTLLLIFMMYFSFKSRQIIQKMLEEDGLLVPMNGFLCFLFPVFYQHYVLHNAVGRFSQATAKHENHPAPQAAPPQASQEDKLAKLEKLGQLREAGLLSEEEFQEEKKKLLS